MKILFETTYMKLAREAKAEAKRKFDFMMPSMPMIEACQADEFDFFQPYIDGGMLTIDQMHQAAERYYLGKTLSGKTMFWMIDDMMQPLDAHIGDTWLSKLLKKREPLLEYWPVKHCLFGEHLLSAEGSVGIVESEASAVILSELFPETIWLAYVYTANLTPQLMQPLRGRKVTIYPRTDPTISNYVFFLEYAEMVRKQYDVDLRIDSTLEYNTTAEQKERCIDILDFIFES